MLMKIIILTNPNSNEKKIWCSQKTPEIGWCYHMSYTLIESNLFKAVLM